MKIIPDLKNEEWKEVEFDAKIAANEKFKISTYGRLINCKKEEDFLSKKYFINGYQTIPLQLATGGRTSRYIHKLVAQHFLPQNDGVYVIHLDYNKKNNRLENLKWATKREKEIHQHTNPDFKNIVKKKPSTAKLTETKVKLIKRKINDPNRRTRMKMIAKQFGISEMQLYRIKTGENWKEVKE